jgi:hypothetical protein
MNCIPENKNMRRTNRVAPRFLHTFEYIHDFSVIQVTPVKIIYVHNIFYMFGNRDVGIIDYRHLICKSYLTIYCWTLILHVLASISLRRSLK